MAVSEYHQNYLNRSDEELKRRAEVKEEELRKIFAESKFVPAKEPVRIAVTGCADHRFVKYHKEIFEKLLGKKVEMITFDITAEHLAGEENVVEHDLTKPLPNGPFDLTFGHVVLKFIETENQWKVIKNCYDSLRKGGMVIQVFDAEDIRTKEVKQKDGKWSVPLERWTAKLDEEKIRYQVMNWKIDLENIPIPIRGLEGGALLIFKD